LRRGGGRGRLRVPTGGHAARTAAVMWLAETVPAIVESTAIPTAPPTCWEY